MKFSSFHTTPDQTAIETVTAAWSPHTTSQQPELQSKNKELTEPLLQPNERQLVVEDSSAGSGDSNSATALNMHDSNTHQ